MIRFLCSVGLAIALIGLAPTSRAGILCDTGGLPTSQIMACAAAAVVGQLPHSDFCDGVNLCHLIKSHSADELVKMMTAEAAVSEVCSSLGDIDKKVRANIVLALAGTGAGCAAVLESGPEIADGLRRACDATDTLQDVAAMVATVFAEGFDCAVTAVGAAALHITDCTEPYEDDPERNLDVCISPSAESHRVPAMAYKPYVPDDPVHNNIDRGFIARQGCDFFNNRDLDVQIAADACGRVLKQVSRNGTYAYNKCGYIITGADWRIAERGESRRFGLHLEPRGECRDMRDGTFRASDREDPILVAMADGLCGNDRCNAIILTRHGFSDSTIATEYTLQLPTRGAGTLMAARRETFAKTQAELQDRPEADRFLFADYKTKKWWSDDLVDDFKNRVFLHYPAPGFEAHLPRKFNKFGEFQSKSNILNTAHWIVIEPAGRNFRKNALIQEHRIRVRYADDEKGRRQYGSVITFPKEVIQVTTCPQVLCPDGRRPVNGIDTDEQTDDVVCAADRLVDDTRRACVHNMLRFAELGPGFHKLTRDREKPRRMLPAWSMYMASPGAVVLEKNMIPNSDGVLRRHNVKMDGVVDWAGYLIGAKIRRRF